MEFDMKFSLTTDAAPVATASPLDVLDLVQMQDDIMSAYENLTDDIKKMEDIESIVCNVNTSLKLLSTYGQSAIPQLNIDKGLESLIGIEEKLITAEKAVSAMEGLLGDAWEAIKKWFGEFVEKVKAFCEKIKNFFIRERVVEKTIVKTVEKEVPVEIVKEVKVYVDKIIEKKVEVPVEPPVTLEDLESVIGFEEFMKEAADLKKFKSLIDHALVPMRNTGAEKYIFGLKPIFEYIDKYLDPNIFKRNDRYYMGIETGAWYGIFKIGNASVNEKFPVTSIEEWSKENYLKAWAFIDTTYCSDTLIEATSLIEDISGTINELDDSSLIESNKEYAASLSEDEIDGAKSLNALRKRFGGNSVAIHERIAILRSICTHILRDVHMLIRTRGEFIRMLDKISHIYMRIDKFAGKYHDAAFWGRSEIK